MANQPATLSLFSYTCIVDRVCNPQQEGQFKPSPAGKLCVTVPISLAAIYGVIRAMLYCIWLSDHAVEVRKVI